MHSVQPKDESDTVPAHDLPPHLTPSWPSRLMPVPTFWSVPADMQYPFISATHLTEISVNGIFQLPTESTKQFIGTKAVSNEMPPYNDLCALVRSSVPENSFLGGISDRKNVVQASSMTEIQQSPGNILQVLASLPIRRSKTLPHPSFPLLDSQSHHCIVPLAAPVPQVPHCIKRNMFASLIGCDSTDADEERQHYGIASQDSYPVHKVSRPNGNTHLSIPIVHTCFTKMGGHQDASPQDTTKISLPPNRYGRRKTSPRRSPTPLPAPPGQSMHKCSYIWSSGEHCTWYFRRRADLLRHRRTVHTERQIRCPTCCGSYSRPDSLERHINGGCQGWARKRRRRDYELKVERFPFVGM